jgi:proteic killer suppression protein
MILMEVSFEEPLEGTPNRSPLQRPHSLIQCSLRELWSIVGLAWYPCYRVTVIRSFKGQATEDLFNGKNSKDARRSCPQSLWTVAARKLDQLDSAGSLEDLRIPPGNRLEALSGSRAGQYSIRINDQYRVCFVWVDDEPDEVEIVDYH